MFLYQKRFERALFVALYLIVLNGSGITMNGNTQTTRKQDDGTYPQSHLRNTISSSKTLPTTVSLFTTMTGNLKQNQNRLFTTNLIRNTTPFPTKMMDFISQSDTTYNHLTRKVKTTHISTTGDFVTRNSSTTEGSNIRITEIGTVANKTLAHHQTVHTSTTTRPMDISYHNEYCNLMETCDEDYPLYKTFPERNCYCDDLCHIFNDCCRNFHPTGNVTLESTQFSCLSFESLNSNDNYGIYVVTSCSGSWTNDEIRSLCTAVDDDILVKTPVTDRSNYRITFRNMYCAQCNYIYDFEYWKTEIKCKRNASSNFDGCKWMFTVPTLAPLRNCKKYVYSTCWSSENDELVYNCTEAPFSLVYTVYGPAYRNSYCAKCNMILETDLYCQMPTSAITTTPRGPYTTGGPVYSFRLLVDLNADSSKTCRDNEIYDILSNICRKIYCATPLVAIKGVCVIGMDIDSKNSNKNETMLSDLNCTQVKLRPEEYELINASMLLLRSKKVFIETFQILASGVFICSDDLVTCAECRKIRAFFNFVADESYLSLVGLLVSIASLFITLITYLCFPTLLNIPGKNLTCLVASLLLAHILFLVSAKFENIPFLCKIVAVLLHFLFLAAFCWMNVIAFDFWMTFSNHYASSGGRTSKRFLFYSMYAWLAPFIIVTVTVSLDLVTLDSKYASLQPGYGNPICWITSRTSLFIFFAGPLALFKCFDFIAFIITMINITRAKQHGAKATNRKDACAFVINLKLSLIMGLTWVFAFAANVTKETTIWYLFIVFNSLQGLFIATCFLCSRQVFGLINEKYNRIKSDLKSSTADTKLTSLAQ